MPRTARSESRSPARTRFGRELERLRLVRGLSIRQATARTGEDGVSRSYWGQLERGSTSDQAGARPVANPSAGTLWAIADALELARPETRALFELAGVNLPVSLRSQDIASPDRLALAGRRGYALNGLHPDVLKALHELLRAINQHHDPAQLPTSVETP